MYTYMYIYIYTQHITFNINVTYFYKMINNTYDNRIPLGGRPRRPRACARLRPRISELHK